MLLIGSPISWKIATGNYLFAFLTLLRLFIKCDVQRNEGFNRVLKLLVERARAILLILLSARGAAKCALGVGSASAPKRWRDRRERAEQLHEDCLANIDEATRILRQEPERFIPILKPPPPEAALPTVLPSEYSKLWPNEEMVSRLSWVLVLVADNRRELLYENVC